ncbi:Uncharacterized protein C16C6.01c [Taphrina deformans PYCC 5710]|uniref:Uncharacterized protein C16C6.01c n=1 Tax=Taphrina deformans (strain PYCC 5710 / ATCC 11124 / CBS 356.35 / IMI 108563 / JCM 9778 / NBRC 8474) TaxID=1097556 RepID=R4X9U9_TAPDE|nr:Uncharacterized protein C16C6.01c [Taphrina deformans PYCC 5710]|eukprot:CCG82573.1 Uncharacterized protein C16C6.01c [Taphrina deformans PYCC 5710]
MASELPLLRFRKWLKSSEQGIKLHPSLKIRCHTDGTGYGVFSTADIVEDTVIMEVPKSSLLSPRTTGISNVLDSADLEPMISCCLAYLYERSKGPESPWHAYIQVCPSVVPISKIWSKQDQSILRGTEVAMVGGTSLKDFQETFMEDVKPFLKLHAHELGPFSALSFKEFSEGMSVVGSRAFEIDAYHGLAMCPFADMLDHEVEEHVHFRTTFDVCPECGEAGGCEHDPEESDDGHGSDGESQGTDETVDEVNGRSQRPIAPHKVPDGHSAASCTDHNHNHDAGDGEGEEDEDTCDFTVIRAIPAGSQVYNTYGDLGNDILLARYGFALRDNPNDRVSLGPETLKLHPGHQEWWSTNGDNLMRALSPVSLTHETLESDSHEAKDGDHRSDSSSTSGSFMDTGPDGDRDGAEEDGPDIEDACFLTHSGRPSTHTILYLFLTTLPTTDLDRKSGPEVKAYMQVLAGTWRYIQPGRGPLPPYLFLDSVRTCLRVIQSCRAVMQHRRDRYPVPYATLQDDRTDRGYTFAKMVRDNEEAIMMRGETYLNLLDHSCQWLLERGN